MRTYKHKEILCSWVSVTNTMGVCAESHKNIPGCKVTRLWTCQKGRSKKLGQLNHSKPRPELAMGTVGTFRKEAGQLQWNGPFPLQFLCSFWKFVPLIHKLKTTNNYFFVVVFSDLQSRGLIFLLMWWHSGMLLSSGKPLFEWEQKLWTKIGIYGLKLL